MSHCFDDDKMFLTESLDESQAWDLLYEMGLSLVNGNLGAKYSPQRGVFVFGPEKRAPITHSDFKTLLDLLQKDRFVVLSRRDQIPGPFYEAWVTSQVQTLFPEYGHQSSCSYPDEFTVKSSISAEAVSIREASLSLEISARLLPWVEDPCHCD